MVGFVAEARDFIPSPVSEPAVGPRQPPIRRVLGTPCSGLKMSGCEGDQTHLVPGLMMTEGTSPLRYTLHGVHGDIFTFKFNLFTYEKGKSIHLVFSCSEIQKKTLQTKPWSLTITSFHVQC